jgi:hypothetical protein
MVPISDTIPKGYRLVFIDELVNSSSLRREAKRILGNWKIAVVLNGFAKGSGYGSEMSESCDQDTPNATDMLIVKSCYNIQS